MSRNLPPVTKRPSSSSSLTEQNLGKGSRPTGDEVREKVDVLLGHSPPPAAVGRYQQATHFNDNEDDDEDASNEAMIPGRPDSNKKGPGKARFSTASPKIAPPPKKASLFGNDLGRMEAGAGAPPTKNAAHDADEAASVHSRQTGASGTSSSGLSGRIMSAMRNANCLSRRMAGVPLSIKALIIVAVPVFLAVGLASFVMTGAIGDLNESVLDRDVAQLASSLTDMIHDITIEREDTFRWNDCSARVDETNTTQVRACDAQFDVLVEARAVTDASGETLNDIVETMDHAIVHVEDLEDAIARIHALPQHRSLVDERTLADTAALDLYDIIIREMIHVISIASTQVEDAAAARLLSRTTLIEQLADELAKMQRLGLVGISHGVFEDAEGREFEALASIVQEMTTTIYALVFVTEDREVFDHYVSMSNTEELLALTAVLVNAVRNNGGVVDPTLVSEDRWDSVLNERIEGVNDVAHAFENEILDHVNTGAAKSRMVIICLALVFTVVLSSIMTWLLITSVQTQTRVLKTEAIKRGRISKATARFFPRAFMRLLGTTSVTEVSAGMSTEICVTVMFMDIRGFTTISEAMSLEDTFYLLREYTELVSPIIVGNGGFIDKMWGDGIMAVFPTADGALHASLSVQHEIQVWNQRNAISRGGDMPRMNVGIGIHTGDVILGTLGDDHRIDGTIIGDAVNVASRLEALTKFFGVSILVSKQVLSACDSDIGSLCTRTLGSVIVKGKTQPVDIFDLYQSDPLPLRDFKAKTQDRFEQAAMLYRAGRLTEASAILDELEAKFPVTVDHAAMRRKHIIKERRRRALADVAEEEERRRSGEQGDDIGKEESIVSLPRMEEIDTPQTGRTASNVNSVSSSLWDHPTHSPAQPRKWSGVDVISDYE